MSNIENLTGMVFGRLTVIERADDHICPSGQHIRQWKCRCSCGNTTIVSSRNLKTGNTASCGCKSTERKTKHNLWNSRIYKIYYGMKARCYSSATPNYNDYGGRGIKICDEWKDDFMSFYNWSMANGYSDELSIDRIDVDGDYSPENCRWVDKIVQANNCRNTYYVTYKGVTKPISDWCRELGLKHSVVSSRLRSGWDVNDAFEQPSEINHRNELVTYRGESKLISDWCAELGLQLKTVYSRLEKGWTIEQALSPISDDRKRKSLKITSVDGRIFMCSSVNEGADVIGIAKSSIRYHIKRYGLPCEYKGWTIEETTAD